MKRFMALLAISACLSLVLAGCGETIQGMAKDVDRVGRGVHKVLFRETD
jgi:predicted small secreted protein